MTFYLNGEKIDKSDVLSYITKQQYQVAMKEYTGKPLRWKTKFGILVLK